jgi:hypothetical protein
VLVLDPDDDADDQPPILPASTAPQTTDVRPPAPGPLRMAKDFRLRPRKMGVRKRARPKQHLRDSGPPIQAQQQQRGRRGLSSSPHLCAPQRATLLAPADVIVAWLVPTLVEAPTLRAAPAPRLSRAPPRAA